MDDGSITLLVALLILVALSAFFSASETAYSSLNQIRLKSRADAGDKQAARVLMLSEHFDSLLSTILIGNNVVNIAAASLGTVLFTRVMGEGYGPTVSTVVLTLVVLIFGEVTPKGLAKEMPETIAIAFAPVLQSLMFLLTPLNFLFRRWKQFLQRHFHSDESDTITEGELVTMVSEAEKDGELTDRESELIRSAIEFDDVEVEDVLTPRVDVVAVADDTPLDELADIFADSGYSRLPVYHDNRGQHHRRGT
jgi:putative hemolysin